MTEKAIIRSRKNAHFNLLESGYLVPVFSGGPGGGKSLLASRIAALFNLPIASAGTMLREQHKLLYPSAAISFEDWYGTLTGKDVKKLNDEIKSTFESGNVIGESRLLRHLDMSKCLYIFVDTDITIKAERLSKDKNRSDYYGKKVRDIVHILKKRSSDEAKVVKQLAQIYGIDTNYDYRDAKHYKLVLDSGTLTIEREIEKVLAMMNVQL